MKTQRNIIYITIICSVISALLYAFCVFDWNPSKCSGGYNWNTYISNLILGVWGSSIISFIVGVVSYNECRRKDMEAFIFSQSDLFVHCMRFKKENSIEWFDEYAKLYRDLSNNWSNIWFLFDPVRQRLFLKEYIDYYGDFIELTQDKYNLLRQTDSVECQKKILDEINEIVIEKKSSMKGICCTTTETNRLTHDMEIVTKNIDEIYRNKNPFHKYRMGKTLLNATNFKVLDKKYENYLNEIKKQMDEFNSTEVSFKMPKEDADYLVECKYLSGYVWGESNFTSKVSCNFIVDHYFDMKARYERDFEHKKPDRRFFCKKKPR